LKSFHASPAEQSQAQAIFDAQRQAIYVRTDRLFAGLMALQWVGAVLAACLISPRTWAGTASQVHPHVWAAVFLGGLLSAFPIGLALLCPGRTLTRQVIAVAQLLMSALLIHVTGGRIETHFHVFGSLAFLAFYRDWRVIASATLVTAADHLVRGAFWPQSVYGLAAASPWLTAEHAGWVLFTDTFLLISCRQSLREMYQISLRQSQLEGAEKKLTQANETLETQVEQRTAALARMQRRNTLLLDSAGEGIYGLDQNGMTLFVNPAAARMLGYEVSELIGQPMHALLHHSRADGSVYPAEECPIHRCIRTGEACQNVDEVFWYKDGTAIEVEYTGTPLAEEGRVVGAVITFRCIAERKQAEAALRESESRYRGLVEHSPDAVVVYSGNRIVYANAAAVTLFAAERAESLLGRLIFDFVHPDYHSLAQRRAARSQQEGRTSLLTQQKYVRLDGAVIDVEAVSTGIVYGGKPAGQVLIRDITERKEAERNILALNDELMQAYDATIEGWSRALDLRDHETEGHSRRVTEMTLRLARAAGLPASEMVHIKRGALLHDIGKMGVPDAVLLKPGPLDDHEWEIMRRHPALAKEMLDPAEFLRPALTVPFCHHEKWDGTGYPQGLRGEEIPLAARLFALVDVWDALSSDRPYRAAWPPERVKDHLHQLAGTHFDPDLVPIFLGLLDSDTFRAETASRAA
jgi:PAS domain S-box-containing protein